MSPATEPKTPAAEMSPPQRGWSALRGRRSARFFILLSLLPSVAGLLASAQYWLVNVDVALAGAFPQLGRALALVLPAPWIVFWKSLSLDVSTVTSLVPLLFFLSTTSALLAFFRPIQALQARVSRSRERFPFSPDYQTTWVQLGLIGTLWAFLLLGNQLNTKQDPAQSVTILVTAFGTALLSTLAGVVAAYLLAPPTCSAYGWLVREAGIGSAKPTGMLDDLKGRLDGLGSSAMAASQALVSGSGREPALRESAARTSEALLDLRDRVSAFDPEAQLTRLVEAVVRKVGDAQAERMRQTEASLHADLVLVATKIGEGLIELGRELRDAHLDAAAQIQERLEGVRTQQAGEQEKVRDSLAALTAALAAEQRRLDALGIGVERQIQGLAAPLRDAAAASWSAQEAVARIRRRTLAMRRRMIALRRSIRQSPREPRFPRLARWLAALRAFMT